VPNKLDGGVIIGLRERWTHARTFPGQSVFAHMDQRGGSKESRKDSTIASRLTVNIYLDDDYKGGEFVFCSGTRNDGTWARSDKTMRPKQGDAVLFYQSIPEFSHAVLPLKSNHKTLLRSDVLYQFKDTADADVGGIKVKGGSKVK